MPFLGLVFQSIVGSSIHVVFLLNAKIFHLLHWVFSFFPPHSHPGLAVAQKFSKVRARGTSGCLSTRCVSIPSMLSIYNPHKLEVQGQRRAALSCGCSSQSFQWSPNSSGGWFLALGQDQTVHLSLIPEPATSRFSTGKVWTSPFPAVLVCVAAPQQELPNLGCFYILPCIWLLFRCCQPDTTAVPSLHQEI